MKDSYLDILTASRPTSRRPRMSMENRAKIFAPFDALRGFDLALMAKEQEWQLFR